MSTYTTLSALPAAGSVADANLILVTASVSGTPTSESATLLQLKNYVLGGTAATATKLASPVTINGVSFDGSQNINITATVSNATTATRLATPITINGVSFDGSANITVPISTLAWSALTSVPTTIAGYGITDAISLTGTQTLTNKTLTQPVISSIANTGILTLPTSTDTLVGRATTDTLTNKSISGGTNTLTNIPNTALTNSSITVNGVQISLGGTGSITTTLAHALTIGSGLTTTSSTFDGSASVTFYLTAASSSQLGGVIVPAASTSGIVNTSGTISLAVASASQIGAVKVDGTSISVSTGVISANSSGLVGTTLNSTVTSSSLTSFGASPTLASPVVTTGITTSGSSINVFNTNATTVNAFGAGTAISIGASTGTITVNNNLTVTGNLLVNGTQTIQNVETINTSVVSAQGIEISGTYSGSYSDGILVDYVNNNGRISVGSGDAITFYNATETSRFQLLQIGTTGNLTMTGGTLATSATTANVFNTTATTVNAFGAATAISVGASTGTTTVNNGLTVTGATTLSSTLTYGGVTLTAAATGTGSMVLSTNPTISGLTATGTFTVQQTKEVFTTIASPGTSATLNFNTASIFYLTGLTSNITAAFTNVPTTAGFVIATSLMIVQGSTAYIPNAVSINGSAQTIRWQGGATPTGTINHLDVISFTLICTGTSTYTVIGALTDFN